MSEGTPSANTISRTPPPPWGSLSPMKTSAKPSPKLSPPPPPSTRAQASKAFASSPVPHLPDRCGDESSDVSLVLSQEEDNGGDDGSQYSDHSEEVRRGEVVM